MDKKPVLVALADKNYLKYAKQVFSGAYFNGGWKGDYLLLAHDVPEKRLQWFRDKGIYIKRCSSFLKGRKNSEINIIHYSKLYLFSQGMKKWSHVIFLDVDTIIRASLDDLLKIRSFAAVPNLQIKFGWYFNKNFLLKKYNFEKPSFCSGIITFNTDIINSNTFQDFTNMIRKYEKYKILSHDEVFFNLYFYNKWQRLPRVYNVCVDKNINLWRLPNHKLKGIILHTASATEPWKKESDFYKEWLKNYKKAESLNLAKPKNIQKWSSFKMILYSWYLLHRYNLYNRKYYWNLVFFVENKFPKIFLVFKKSKGFILGLFDLRSLITKYPCVSLGMIQLRKPQILGMTTEWEQAFVRWFAKEKYSGSGEMVELGCWLGSISISLSQGLKQNKKMINKISRIHTFDKFVWQDWMNNSVLQTNLNFQYHENDDFSDEFKKRIKIFRKFIKIYNCNLKNTKWNQNKKIELLFIDAGESWDIANDIIKIFYPALMPGRSIYVEQNFYYYNTYWIHLLLYRFRSHFKSLFQIPNSTSAVFIYKKTIPLNLFKTKYLLSDFSNKEIEAAFNWSMNLNKNSWQADILAAKSMCLLARGKIKESKDLFLQIEKLRKLYSEGHFTAYIKDYKNKYNQALNIK